MLISIEIMLLSITFLILVSSLNIDDIIGQAYAIYIIVVAGAESAIGQLNTPALIYNEA
jgi:NADH:ubiquinone oxidoreductase subunit K